MTAKEIMAELAIQLAKKPKDRDSKRVQQLNRKLDQALGTVLEEEDRDAAFDWEVARNRD